MRAGRVCSLVLLAASATLPGGCARERAVAPLEDETADGELSAIELAPIELAELHVRAAESGERPRALRALSLLDSSGAEGGAADLLRARALLVRIPQDLGGASRALASARASGLHSVELDELEGLIAFALGDPERARRLLERALGRGERSGHVALTLGEIALEEQDPARARELFARALAELPAEAEPAFKLAEAHAFAGDVEAQRRALDEALRRDPAHLGARLQRARLNAQGGVVAAENVDAILHGILLRDEELSRVADEDPVARSERRQLAERGLELEPDVAEWALRLARASARGGDCERAVELLGELEVLGGTAGLPESQRELAQGAAIARLCGRAPLALRLAEAALVQGPAGPSTSSSASTSTWQALAAGVAGEAWLKLDRPERALGSLQTAVAHAPFAAEWRSLLAQALQLLGWADEAKRELAFARALDDEPADSRPSGREPRDLASFLEAGPIARLELAEWLVRAAEDGQRKLAPRAQDLLSTRARNDGAAALLLARARLADENQDFGRARQALEMAATLGGADEVAIEQFAGLVAHALGEDDEAARRLEAATEGGPRDAQVALALGEITLDRGEHAAAVRHLERAVEGAPTAARPAFLLAQALDELGEEAAREAALDLALEREPDHLGARLARGRHAMARGSREPRGARGPRGPRGDSGETDLTVHRLLTRDHDLSRRPSSDAEAALERLRIAEQLVGTEPSAGWWRARWADLLVQQGRPAAAGSVLLDARRLPSSRLVTGWLARLAYQCAEYALAAELAERGLALPADPPLPPPLEARLPATLGACRMREGRVAEALPALSRSLELLPYQADVRVLLALAHERMGARQDAMREYRTALQLDPQLQLALANLGSLLRDEGRPEEALLVLEEACRLAPTDAAAQANLGMALGDLGRVEESLAALALARGLAPSEASIAWALGAGLARAGREEEARAHLVQAARDERVGQEARRLLEALTE